MRRADPAALAWRKLSALQRARILHPWNRPQGGETLPLMLPWDALSEAQRDTWRVQLDAYLDLARSLGWLHRDSKALAAAANDAYLRLRTQDAA